MSDIKFKSIRKKRPIRRRSSSSDEETPNNDETEELDHSEKLAETLEMQKLRKRPHGVNAVALASGKKISKVDELVHNDPELLKLQTGGLLSLDKARIAKSQVDEEDGIAPIVGTQFSKETRVRDEDEEMKKFIEAEMEIRRGKNLGMGYFGGSEDNSGTTKYMTPEEAALQELPEHLKASTGQKSEEMLSSQMLSGIPEVDLGIDEKIRNIEATDAAKRKASDERVKRAKFGTPSAFVPSNLAVNFKHHNRFKPEIEERIIIDNEKALASAGTGNKNMKTQGGSKRPLQKDETKFITEKTVVVGQLPEERVIAVSGGSGSTIKENDPTRATDDIHVSKFKKHFQRK